MKGSISSYISKQFEFNKHQTNIRTEVLAGVSTFLSLSYIFVVNPSILSEGGIDKSVALFATVIASAFATLLMGWWAKKPFVLAPGLEMNSYVVYFMVIGLGFTWQQGLGAVFWSGIIFLILTLTNAREKIIDAIPDSLKIGLSASVGVFLMIIALRVSNVLVYEGITLSGAGSILSPNFLVLASGLALVLVLQFLKVRASILISIILTTILAHQTGLGNADGDRVEISEKMFSGIAQFDLSVLIDPAIISPIIILFVVDFYGSVAKFIGLTLNTSILTKDKKLPKLKETLLVDGAATLVGSGLGTTSVTTFVESGVGIGVGGRTGLTAVVCALLMMLFIPLAPIINLVPVIATTGALFWVGIQLFPKPQKIKLISKVELISIMLMAATTLLTFSLDKAMLLGFSVYILGQLLTGNIKKINLFLLLSTLLILIATVLSMLNGQ